MGVGVLKIKDLSVENQAPDTDTIIVSVGDWKIDIWRDEDGEVFVHISDDDEGSLTQLVLGKEGSTQKL